MRYIDGEGALFRTNSPMNEFPQEVWSPRRKEFVRYEGDVPKPQGWGMEISREEAEAWVAEQRTDGK